MVKEKTNKLVSIVSAVVLPVVSFFNAGCESSGDSYNSTNLAVAGAAAKYSALNDPSLNSRQASGLGIIGGALGVLARQRAMKEAAREGRSEVNVYVNEPKQEKKPLDRTLKNKIKIFTCNYWKDFNNNGFFNPEEYVGIKNKFRENEKVGLIVRLPMSRIEKKYLNLKIFGPKGELVYYNSSRVSNKLSNNIVFYYGDKVNLLDDILDEGGFGAYKAVAYLDGKFICSHEFEVIE